MCIRDRASLSPFFDRLTKSVMDLPPFSLHLLVGAGEGSVTPAPRKKEKSREKSPPCTHGGPIAQLLEVLLQPGNIFFQASDSVFAAIAGFPLHHIQNFTVPLGVCGSLYSFPIHNARALGHIPVSYTQLDVYKRQPQLSPKVKNSPAKKIPKASASRRAFPVMWATALWWCNSRSLAILGINREAKEESREEGKYSMGMAMP